MNYVRKPYQDRFEERPNIERNILVPFGRKKILFSEIVQPGTYCRTGNAIAQKGYQIPTGDLTSILIPYCFLADSVKSKESQREFAKHVKNILNRGILYVYNRNIWTSEGVYVVQDEKVEGCSAKFDLSELEESIIKGGFSPESGVRFSLDGKVRFAPKQSYQLGSHSLESWEKDGYVVASLGIEGAKKFGKIASMFEFSQKTHGLEIQKGQKPVQRVTSLNSEGGLIGTTLNDENDGSSKGYAFGARELK